MRRWTRINDPGLWLYVPNSGLLVHGGPGLVYSFLGEQRVCHLRIESNLLRSWLVQFFDGAANLGILTQTEIAPMKSPSAAGLLVQAEAA